MNECFRTEGQKGGSSTHMENYTEVYLSIEYSSEISRYPTTMILTLPQYIMKYTTLFITVDQFTVFNTKEYSSIH